MSTERIAGQISCGDIPVAQLHPRFWALLLSLINNLENFHTIAWWWWWLLMLMVMVVALVVVMVLALLVPLINNLENFHAILFQSDRCN